MTKVNVLRLLAILGALLFLFAYSPYMHAQVTIVQISDAHIGLARAPEAAENLRRAVQMANQRNPDAVIVSGDIGERESAWEQAKDILKGLHAKVYYVPGNHDVHSDGPAKYRSEFGDDYYKFQVKYVTVYALDSQLLGNWDKFEAHTEPSMSSVTRTEGDKMLDWLASQEKGGGDHDRDRDKKDKKKKDKKDRDRDNDHDRDDRVAIAVQHVPDERDGGFPKDSKPYWTVNGEYKQREEQILKKLGVHDILVGHWHDARVFDAGGFRWHVAPATSWSTFGGKLGFAVHTITPDGHVNTEFVYLDGSTEKH